jgi:hypothetical protein
LRPILLHVNTRIYDWKRKQTNGSKGESLGWGTSSTPAFLFTTGLDFDIPLSSVDTVDVTEIFFP